MNEEIELITEKELAKAFLTNNLCSLCTKQKMEARDGIVDFIPCEDYEDGKRDGCKDIYPIGDCFEI